MLENYRADEKRSDRDEISLEEDSHDHISFDKFYSSDE